MNVSMAVAPPLGFPERQVSEEAERSTLGQGAAGSHTGDAREVFWKAGSNERASTTAKPKARQVAARYLQPKAPAASGAHSGLTNGPLTGRASLAGHSSTGWIELQHPNHAATPLMVPTGSVGACTTARGTRSRSGLVSRPTPAVTKPPAQAQDSEQQFVTPGPRAASFGGLHTAGRGAQGTTSAVSHSRQQQGLQTPTCFTMSAGFSRPLAMPDRPSAFSADLTAALSAQPRAAEDDMRAKLSRWREHKQQQQSSRAAAKPAVFKEPAPKPTLFRATAATRANKDPTTGRKRAAAASVMPAKATAMDAAAVGPERGSSMAAGAVKGAAGCSVSSPSAGGAAEGSTVGLGPADAGGSSASPSAFTATMATLQHSGGNPRGSKPSSKAESSRPSPFPLLKLDQAGVGSSSCAGTQQQQQPGGAVLSPFAGSSSTKIPKLNLSSLATQHQQHATAQQQHHMPLSSRWPSSSGGVDAMLPDATPLSVRDALPSKLPRTPRTSAPEAAQQQLLSRSSTPPEGSDQHVRQLDTAKADLEQLTNSPSVAAGKAAVPTLKLGVLLGGKPSGQDTAAGSHTRPAPGSSCLSARVPGAAASRGSAAKPGHAKHTTQHPGTPSGRTKCSSGVSAAAGTPASAKQVGKTPRGLVPAATRLPTPRCLASSMAAAAPAAPAASSASANAGPAARQADAEKAEDVRQQLRLLRMQHLQLRHLNARMEAAAKARQEKVDATMAAAAAAVVDLSGQLLRLKAQAMQSGWQCQLEEVLQQQQVKLQAWAAAQAQHCANVHQLQEACSSALSHVPLLNGATVGHDPEQPDLQALQRQLQQGMQLLGELQPAIQLLMSGGAASSSSSAGSSLLGLAAAVSGACAQPGVNEHLHPKGIKDTASLSHELMAVAEDECALLQQLSQQLAELSDLQLYVNSMQVQLLHMREAAVGDEL